MDLDLHNWMFDDRKTLLDHCIEEIVSHLTSVIEDIPCKNCRPLIEVLKIDANGWLEYKFPEKCDIHRSSDHANVEFIKGLSKGIDNLGKIIFLESKDFSLEKLEFAALESGAFTLIYLINLLFTMINVNASLEPSPKLTKTDSDGLMWNDKKNKKNKSNKKSHRR